MLKGFTNQFTNRVMSRPFGFFTTPRNPPKSIFNIIG